MLEVLESPLPLPKIMLATILNVYVELVVINLSLFLTEPMVKDMINCLGKNYSSIAELIKGKDFVNF